MNIHQVTTDLFDRKVELHGTEKSDVLRKKLADEYHGIHHLPFLLFDSAITKLEDVGLDQYEVLPFEPLHAISGHTKNLYAEIPYHLNTEEKKLFEKAVKASFSGKEVKRASDYRQSLIDIIIYLDGKIGIKFTQLLKQMAEIQEISYADDKDRSVQKVLRLHNLTFSHGMLLKELMFPPRKLTTRKLFGHYEHGIVREASIQYRIMALSSSNTENEERAFTFMKDVSKNCSNHHPDNVIATCVVRSQVREDWNRHLGSKTSSTKNKISKHGEKLMSERRNTTFPFSLLKNHSLEWQAHLERIGDFLQVGCWKENSEGITFFDKETENQVYPRLHHFRSSSIAKEYKYEFSFIKLCLVPFCAIMVLQAFIMFLFFQQKISIN